MVSYADTVSDDEVLLPKGITLEALARRLKKDGVKLESLTQGTPVLVFRAAADERPVYETPEDGVPTSRPPGGDTSVFSWEDRGAPRDDVLAKSVAVPLTPTNRTLKEDEITVGRATTNDIRLVSPQVSKLHVTFLKIDGEWRIQDGGSSNGTRLNGVRLEPENPYRLRPSDEIVIGDVTVHYLDAEGVTDLCSLVQPPLDD